MGGAAGRALSAALRTCAAALAALAVLQQAAADPAAWRISGEKGGEVALLGSVHVLRAADYPLPPLVDALYARADTLVMELDLDDLDPLAEQSTLLAAAVLPPNRSLRSVVDARVYALAAARSRALGVDLALLDRFEPWLVAITLLDQGLRNLGFESERGLEQYLVGKARGDHKEIVGLETLSSQVNLFDALPAGQQQALLAQTVQELDAGLGSMNEVAAAWRAGRLDVLSEKLLADFDDFPGLYDSLVTQRNRAWTEVIERYLRDGRRHLVVVGALHLVGRNNVIDMLEKRGHRASRVE
jgi:uncharacterized protein YbaP (TraB family)